MLHMGPGTHSPQLIATSISYTSITNQESPDSKRFYLHAQFASAASLQVLFAWTVVMGKKGNILGSNLKYSHRLKWKTCI